MPKLNPSQLARPSDVTETRAFEDPAQPGQTLTLTFYASAERAFSDGIVGRARDLIRDHITGRSGGKPAPLIEVGGRPVTLTHEMCAQIAGFLAMERPPEGEPAYDFLEWRALSVTMPGAYEQIVEWANDLLQRARGQLGN